MSTRIRFEFLGEAQLDRTILRRVAHSSWEEYDARPLWDELADRFAKMEARQFRSQGGYASGGWAPLSPRYAAWKARARTGFGRKNSKKRKANEAAGRRQAGNTILVLYGDLRDSLTQRPFGIEVIRQDRMILGTAVPYAKYHQAGSGRLPRRRPIEFRESERRAWVKLIQRFIITGRAGGRLREF